MKIKGTAFPTRIIFTPPSGEVVFALAPFYHALSSRIISTTVFIGRRSFSALAFNRSKILDFSRKLNGFLLSIVSGRPGPFRLLMSQS